MNRKKLHTLLDLLVAEYIIDTGRLLRVSSIMDFVQWHESKLIREENIYQYEIKVGDRVRVFDNLLFHNDFITPLTQTMVWGTVKKLYKSKEGRELMDVRQDRIRHKHLGGEEMHMSYGHFVDKRRIK